MTRYWYKIVPVFGTVYKYKVVEYHGSDAVYTYRILRYFKDRKKAEEYLKRCKNARKE